LKNKREQKVEEGSRETDAGREDQLIAKVSQYGWTESSICSNECRIGQADGCSDLEGRRSHIAEAAIGRKSGPRHICHEAFRT
jgi:hypothetical protein